MDKENGMQITATGCIKYEDVEYEESRHGHSVWVCKVCGHEFIEVEDLGSGG